MTAEVTEDEYVVEAQETGPSGVVGAIAWGIETIADELIYWVVIATGCVAVVQGTELPAWFIGFMGAIITDLVKKKYKSEQ